MSKLSSLLPWACQFCKLVNWPQHMDKSVRVACHKCGAAKPVAS